MTVFHVRGQLIIIIIIIIIIVAKLGCGNPAVEPYDSLTHIVGGVEARKYSWPWQCVVWITSGFGGDSYDCGGSVIDRRHILTAASCV